jgi:hypothetical protein
MSLSLGDSDVDGAISSLMEDLVSEAYSLASLAATRNACRVDVASDVTTSPRIEAAPPASVNSSNGMSTPYLLCSHYVRRHVSQNHVALASRRPRAVRLHVRVSTRSALSARDLHALSALNVSKTIEVIWLRKCLTTYVWRPITTRCTFTLFAVERELA